MAKKTSSKSAPKIKAASKARTKGEIYNTLAEHAGVSRKQVSAVFDGLNQMMVADLSKDVVFKLPGMFKVSVQKRPATKAREGINPFTKEKVMFKAKPARKVVKARALKSLKDAI